MTDQFLETYDSGNNPKADVTVKASYFMSDSVLFKDAHVDHIYPASKKSSYAEQRDPIENMVLVESFGETELQAPPIAELQRKRLVRETPRTTDIQVWEGRVDSIEKNKMSVRLSDKHCILSDRAAMISLEWVAEQDKDLVKPGAVFYLTLYKETTRSKVKNSQELRFRRLPNWSSAQIERIRAEAEDMKSLFTEGKLQDD
ncbi:MAG: hypothetical protein ABW153_00600 [Sedimenticola sp.]